MKNGDDWNQALILASGRREKREGFHRSSFELVFYFMDNKYLGEGIVRRSEIPCHQRKGELIWYLASPSPQDWIRSNQAALQHSLGFGERDCGPLKIFCNLFLWITLLFSLLVKKSFIGQNKSFFGPLELVEKLCPEASDIATSVRNLPELKWVRSSYINLMFKKKQKQKTPCIYQFLNSLPIKRFLI